MLFACSDEHGSSDSRSEVRNTILISIDTLRADHLGIYGYERDTTPNLSRYFAKANIYERGISSAPCTIPSVAQFTAGSFTPDRNTPRLAEILRSQGVTTAAFTNQKHFNRKSMGIYRGFDTFHNWSSLPRLATRQSDEAIEWLRRNHQRGPFFLWVHYLDPHEPYNPPDPYRVFDEYPTSYEDGDRDRVLKAKGGRNDAFTESPETAYLGIEQNKESRGPGHVFEESEIANFVALYDGEILYVDHEIGRLLEELDRLGLRNSSLVFVTADHGEWLGEYNLWDHCMTLNQREIHVPLLMRAGDQGLKEAARIADPVSTLDIVPTALDWQGIDYDANRFIGTSLIGGQELGGVVAFWRGQTVLVNGNWKLYHSGEPIALFDISRDPDEQHNLIESEPVRVQEMARNAEAYKALTVRMKTETEQTIEQLKAIGYLH